MCLPCSAVFFTEHTNTLAPPPFAPLCLAPTCLASPSSSPTGCKPAKHVLRDGSNIQIIPASDQVLPIHLTQSESERDDVPLPSASQWGVKVGDSRLPGGRSPQREPRSVSAEPEEKSQTGTGGGGYELPEVFSDDSKTRQLSDDGLGTTGDSDGDGVKFIPGYSHGKNSQKMGAEKLNAVVNPEPVTSTGESSSAVANGVSETGKGGKRRASLMEQIKWSREQHRVGNDHTSMLGQIEDAVALDQKRKANPCVKCARRTRAAFKTMPVILPDSKFRTRWDTGIMLLVAYYAFSVPLYLGFIQDDPPAVVVVDWLAWVIFLVDIALNFNTAYKEDGVLKTLRKDIAR